MFEVIGLETERIYLTGDEAYCRRELIRKFANDLPGQHGYGCLGKETYDEPLIIKEVTK